MAPPDPGWPPRKEQFSSFITAFERTKASPPFPPSPGVWGEDPLSASLPWPPSKIVFEAKTKLSEISAAVPPSQPS